uniref:ShKT domain-containing protein n=1 Tax=Rhabditophanes sp. KR3021 TaxID=114890 RepID=A0AC35TT86_9BILA
MFCIGYVASRNPWEVDGWWDLEDGQNSCDDIGVDCWCKKALCNNREYRYVMRSTCRRSCGGCVDWDNENGTGEGNGNGNGGIGNGGIGNKDVNSETNSNSGTNNTIISVTICKDKATDCASKKSLCKNNAYKNVLKTNCFKTCAYCT